MRKFSANVLRGILEINRFLICVLAGLKLVSIYGRFFVIDDVVQSSRLLCASSPIKPIIIMCVLGLWMHYVVYRLERKDENNDR